MSAIVIEKLLVHYEVIGRGRPIIFLHSWLGSWRSWMPLMESVSDRYRTTAMDFWGFGDSAPQRDAISISRYVDQLNGFIESLGIVTPHLVGHGLGGLVAVRAASEQPSRFGKVLIAGTPIIGSVVRQVATPSGLTRLLGRNTASNDVWIKLVKQAAATVEDSAIFNTMLEDLDNTDPEVVSKVINAISDVDLRTDLARLNSPLLAIYGALDSILPIHRSHIEIEDVEGRFRQMLTFEKSGHFPFLDEPNQFTRAILEFFSDTDKVIELKEQWKRRVSQREYL